MLRRCSCCCSWGCRKYRFIIRSIRCATTVNRLRPLGVEGHGLQRADVLRRRRQEHGRFAGGVREPIRSRYSLYRGVQRPGTRCDDAFRFADRPGIPSGGLFARRRGDGPASRLPSIRNCVSSLRAPSTVSTMSIRPVRRPSGPICASTAIRCVSSATTCVRPISNLPTATT